MRLGGNPQDIEIDGCYSLRRPGALEVLADGPRLDVMPPGDLRGGPPLLALAEPLRSFGAGDSAHASLG